MIPSGPWSAAMDVGGWLRSLGLGQYEALFRASEIDADILPELTDACETSERLQMAPMSPGTRSGPSCGYFRSPMAG